MPPWKALGLGENGTFNSEDTVQLPVLINYFKPLSLVAEQCLLSGNICQSPQRATGARLLHVDSPLILRLLLRYFLCISFSWNEDSLTVKGDLRFGLYFIRRSKTCMWFSDYPEGPFAEAVGAIVCLLVGALRNCRGMLAFFFKVS